MSKFGKTPVTLVILEGACMVLGESKIVETEAFSLPSR